MENLTAHAANKISFLEKCPITEKIYTLYCTEGWVSLSNQNSANENRTAPRTEIGLSREFQIVTLLLASIPVLALLLWHILACLGNYIDNIKGKETNFLLKLLIPFRGRRDETFG